MNRKAHILIFLILTLGQLKTKEVNIISFENLKGPISFGEIYGQVDVANIFTRFSRHGDGIIESGTYQIFKVNEYRHNNLNSIQKFNKLNLLCLNHSLVILSEDLQLMIRYKLSYLIRCPTWLSSMLAHQQLQRTLCHPIILWSPSGAI